MRDLGKRVFGNMKNGKGKTMKALGCGVVTALVLALSVEGAMAQPIDRGGFGGGGQQPRGDRGAGGDRGPGRDRGGFSGQRGFGGQRGMRPVNPLVEALDADGDGEISAQEIANAAAALKKLDKDSDGKLTQEELRPQFGGPGGQSGFGSRGRPSGGDFVERLMSADKNSDGKVTKDELPERAQRMLERVDTNGDGAIDRQEAEAAAKQFQQGSGRRPEGGDRPDSGGPGRGGDFVQRLMDNDKNGDGKVSKDELPEFLQRMMERFDTNGDGAVDRQEAEAAAKQFQQGGGRRPQGGDRPSAGGTSDGAARPGGDFVQRLMANDKNGDGKVSKDELPEPMQRMIERVDTNNDGSVDRQEAEAAAQKFRDRGGRSGQGGQGGDRPDRPRRPDA